MSLHRAAVIAVGLGFGATAANADWQYTKWNMTPSQVIEASNGQAEMIKPLTREYRQRGKWVRSSYKSGELAFDVVFRFDVNSKGLNMIKLRLKDKSQCDFLVSALKSEHENSIAKVISRGWRILSWNDQKSNSRLSYIEGRIGGSPVSCGIEYTPTKSGA